MQNFGNVYIWGSPFVMSRTDAQNGVDGIFKVYVNQHDFVSDIQTKIILTCIWELSWMDLLANEQNFDLDKSRQKFHHSLKEHHKISNIPKFRCKML